MTDNWRWLDDLTTQLLMETNVEVTLRSRIWETNIQDIGLEVPLSPASWDRLSEEMHHVAGRRKPFITESIAATLLVISNDNSIGNRHDHLGELLRFEAQLHATIEPVLHGKFHLDPRMRNTSQRLLTLHSWISDASMNREKYLQLRKLRAKDLLSGIHQELHELKFSSGESASHFWEHAKKHPDHPGDSKKRDWFAKLFVDVPRELDFCRKRNPILCGKLNVNLLVDYEQFGLGFANSGAVVYSLLHVYNSMKQLQLITGVCSTFEQLIEMHMLELFGSELPTDAKAIAIRFHLGAGISLNAVAQLRNVRQNGRILETLRRNPNSDKKGREAGDDPWAMVSSPLVRILRSYFHDHYDLMQMLSEIDRYLQKQSKTKSPRSLRQDGTIPFLEMLELELSSIWPPLQFDCIEATQVCIGLFKKMEEKIRELDARNISAQQWEDVDWTRPNSRGFEIARRVMDDLPNAPVHTESRSDISHLAVSVQIAAEVMQDHISAAASNVSG